MTQQTIWRFIQCVYAKCEAETRIITIPVDTETFSSAQLHIDGMNSTNISVDITDRISDFIDIAGLTLLNRKLNRSDAGTSRPLEKWSYRYYLVRTEDVTRSHGVSITMKGLQ